MKLDGKKRREERKWERVRTLDAQNDSYIYIMGRAGGWVVTEICKFFV